jgi:hypothetical protein
MVEEKRIQPWKQAWLTQNAMKSTKDSSNTIPGVTGLHIGASGGGATFNFNPRIYDLVGDDQPEVVKRQ